MNEPLSLYDALQECLVALERGEDLEACLARYPDLADQLRPALEGAQLARAVRDTYVPNAVRQRSRARLLGKAARLRARSPAGSPRLRWYRLRSVRIVLAAVLLALCFLSVWQGLYGASAKALPGDPLYAVKRAAEDVVLKLAPNVETRHTIEATYNQRRVAEVAQLLSENRVEKVSLEGVLTEKSTYRWLVDTIPVAFNSQTVVIGDIQEGRVIEVEGETQPEGWVMAHEVHLRYYELNGEVTQIGAQRWTVADSQFAILPGTQIDPGLRVGDQALVLIYSDDNGHLSARAILRQLVVGPTPAPAFTPFEIEFNGQLQAHDAGALTVSGKTVRLTSQTELAADLQDGDTVSVLAWVSADGGLTASKVERLAPAPTREPASTGSNQPAPGDDAPGNSSQEINPAGQEEEKSTGQEGQSTQSSDEYEDRGADNTQVSPGGEQNSGSEKQDKVGTEDSHRSSDSSQPEQDSRQENRDQEGSGEDGGRSTSPEEGGD